LLSGHQSADCDEGRDNSPVLTDNFIRYSFIQGSIRTVSAVHPFQHGSGLDLPNKITKFRSLTGNRQKQGTVRAPEADRPALTASRFRDQKHSGFSVDLREGAKMNFKSMKQD
jgi:hypothetical protein